MPRAALYGAGLFLAGFVLGTLAMMFFTPSLTRYYAYDRERAFRSCVAKIPAEAAQAFHQRAQLSPRQRAIDVLLWQTDCAFVVHGLRPDEISRISGFRFIPGNDLWK